MQQDRASSAPVRKKPSRFAWCRQFKMPAVTRDVTGLLNFRRILETFYFTIYGYLPTYVCTHSYTIDEWCTYKLETFYHFLIMCYLFPQRLSNGQFLCWQIGVTFCGP
jgi:hypothetical protein